MTRHYPDLGGASDWLEISFISREKQWWRREMSTFFSG